MTSQWQMNMTSPSPTLRRRHNTEGLHHETDPDGAKQHSRRPLSSLKQALALVVVVLFSLCAYHITTQGQETAISVSSSQLDAEYPVVSLRAGVTRSNTASNEPSDHPEHDPKVSQAPIAPPKDFDCAIFWLRMPKTASTTIAQTFIRPLFHQGNFTNIELGPNSCIAGVGGCAPFWREHEQMKQQQRQQQQMRQTGNRDGSYPEKSQSLAPPYGRKRTASENQSKYNQRCFPSAANSEIRRETYCQEYDEKTSTMNFGPNRPQNPKRKNVKLPSKVQAHFDAGAKITTHVGLDPSLFGWVLPPNPMVFSTFRDPLERIFSAFHYGIQFGGGKPGAVGKCNLPGVKGPVKDRVERWGDKVVETREIATLQNNTAPYQNLLRLYLRTCHMANDNAYVQFLDPDTKNVDVAIQNLEDYVIVGLQNDMGETMTRWVNITRRSCRNHKHFTKMETVFADIFAGMTADGEMKKFRESKITVDEAEEATQRRLSVAQQLLSGKGSEESAQSNNPQPTTGINLISPDFSTLDDDLKELITNFTAGDQKVWQRVLELYEMQREWGRQ